ncbi:hypothetical protein DAPPUDRAFT_278239 [Daphnia pulex]|uniref:Uncharacterized protein n=1 Tax=Daphnia pulex TaxID=6669 RepID=E9I6U4_DAPPU|nr:hypothetical protein DAPPUDRAFT_278239 [Daphnia pulex]|eukprot:EFX60286.1 hypothetical protein DAPPUDRAFT_278239 [Daphnia pulex]
MVDLLMQPQNLQLGAQIDLIIMRRRLTILVRLPVLAHHNDGRLHRRQRRKQQVQEDEGIGIKRHPHPVQYLRIQNHPAEEDDGEGNDEPPAATDRRDMVRQTLAKGRAFFVDDANILRGFAFVDTFQHTPFRRRQGIARFAEQLHRQIVDRARQCHASASAISVRLLAMP